MPVSWLSSATSRLWFARTAGPMSSSSVSRASVSRLSETAPAMIATIDEQRGEARAGGERPAERLAAVVAL